MDNDMNGCGLTVQNDNLVSGVNIKALSQWESCRIIVQRGVSGRIVNRNWGMSESGHELLDISDALHTCDRRAKCRVIPEEQIETWIYT